jgi:ubiquinone biosynthesis protein
VDTVSLAQEASQKTVEEAANANGGFELLKEQPPQSLLRRYFVTQQHFLGLVIGGGFAYVRARQAEGAANTLAINLLRILLFFTWPFINRELVMFPFPVQFRRRLEMLGPTYIKLGQILSLREDLLPTAITEELQNLLDRLPVVTFERFKELIEADLQRPVASAFAWISPTPLGSASLAQTHRALLHTGEEVVLKVIKPGVEETIQRDVTLLRLLANFLQIFLARYQPKRTIYEFCTYTLREIDLRNEADNAETFAASFKDHPGIRFPKIYREFSGHDVLCMEFFAGKKPNAADALTLTAQERNRVIDLGVGSIVQMIFQDGFFHADLHPGNMIIFDNLQIGFIDLGMVGRLDDETRKGLLFYFYSLVMGEAGNAARVLTSLAQLERKSNPEGFRREVADLNRRWLGSSKFHRFSAAQLILQSVALAGRYHIYYPEEIILMVKALVTVEGVSNLLEPGLELTTAARKPIQNIILHEFGPNAIARKVMISGPEFLDALLESPQVFAQGLQRLDKEIRAPQVSEGWRGLREVMLAGFCLVAVAILIAAGVTWWAWSVLLLAAIGLAIAAWR